MKILVAPDKFKGSLDASEVCDAIAGGLKKSFSESEITTCPLADGGDGFLNVIISSGDFTLINKKVLDPLNREITSQYAISKDGSSAFIEMAGASGLVLLKASERCSMTANSFGTGQLIAAALEHNVNRIYLGVGGSASTDAGMGMACALGYQFIDNQGKILKPSGENMGRVVSIDSRFVNPLIGDVEIYIACDVTNPFWGDRGAAYVFAPQKGANPVQVKSLDQSLKNFAQILQRTFDMDINGIAGSGAAGGLAGGATAFLGAKLIMGFDFVSEVCGIHEKLRRSDVVVTGEGSFDEQSFDGKVVGQVARKASHLGVPTVVICGVSTVSRDAMQRHGISCALSLVDDGVDRNTAIKNAKNLIEYRAELLGNTLKHGIKYR